MTKAEIVPKEAEEVQIRKVAPGRLFGVMTACIEDALKTGEKVTFVGFVTFPVSKANA